MVFAALCGLLPRAGELRADPIREIVVAENSKTTDDTVRYLANIEEGDEWNLDLQEEVRLQLITSGLFKEVEVHSEPHPYGGVKVIIVARDKHTWAIAPTYYNQPTNKGGGVGFGEANLFGLNKQLLLYAQYATGDSFFVVGFRDPSLFGSPFRLQLDVFGRRERVFEYQPETTWIVHGERRGNPLVVRQSRMQYLQTGMTLGWQVARSLIIDARARVAKVSYYETLLGPEATEPDVDLRLPLGCVEAGTCELPKPGGEGWDIAGSLSVTFNRIANYYGIASGERLILSVEHTALRRKADFEYGWMEARGVVARRLFSTHNVILRAGGSIGNHLPFHAEFTAGGPGLRGYKNRQFRGNRLAEANLEYSFQLFNYKGFALRPLLFVDGSYARFYDTQKAADTGVRNYLPEVDREFKAGFRTAVGGGTRVYIRQVAIPLLGLDVGYGLESGGIEIYFAIGLSDV